MQYWLDIFEWVPEGEGERTPVAQPSELFDTLSAAIRRFREIERSPGLEAQLYPLRGWISDERGERRPDLGDRIEL